MAAVKVTSVTSVKLGTHGEPSQLEPFAASKAVTTPHRAPLGPPNGLVEIADEEPAEATPRRQS